MAALHDSQTMINYTLYIISTCLKLACNHTDIHVQCTINMTLRLFLRTAMLIPAAHDIHVIGAHINIQNIYKMVAFSQWLGL